MWRIYFGSEVGGGVDGGMCGCYCYCWWEKAFNWVVKMKCLLCIVFNVAVWVAIKSNSWIFHSSNLHHFDSKISWLKLQRNREKKNVIVNKVAQVWSDDKMLFKTATAAQTKKNIHEVKA